MLQLREKELPSSEYIKLAIKVKKLTSKYNVPLIVNDSLEVAIASSADGVHLGQSDNLSSDIRDKIGADKILGVSATTIDQALKAQDIGADYIGVGSVFHTSSKDDAKRVEISLLKDISSSVSLPVVAIGGIDENNISKLAGSGILGVSIISAIFSQSDVFSASVRLKTLAEKIIYGDREVKL